MKVYVRDGDSIWYFSQLFKVPMELIIDSNPNINPEKLLPGEEIRIPGYQKVPYLIQKGDTFWKIAVSKFLEADAVMLLNQHIIPSKCVSDVQIFLPIKVASPCFLTNSACDYQKLIQLIDELRTVYPFISVNQIGKSLMGKSIQEIRVGKGNKKVHMNASFHANEWITTLVLVSLLNSYLLSLTNGNRIRGKNPIELYQNIELSIVPMVNPDGVDLVLNGPPAAFQEQINSINGGSEEFVHWKANIRGVDLNKQFPANWEIDKRKAPHYPSPRDYPGRAPLTEPEAIAMAELAQKNHFDCVLAFHTQGEEFYWGYEGFEGPESEGIAKEFAKGSGYKAVRYVNSHGGFKDWFLQEFRRPGFTIELGKGINPLPLSQFNEIYRRTAGIFFIALTIF